MKPSFYCDFHKWCSGANQIPFHNVCKKMHNDWLSETYHVAGTRASLLKASSYGYFYKWCSAANKIASLWYRVITAWHRSNIISAEQCTTWSSYTVSSARGSPDRLLTDRGTHGKYTSMQKCFHDDWPVAVPLHKLLTLAEPVFHKVHCPKVHWLSDFRLK